MNGRWLAGKVAAAILTLIFVLIFNFFLFRAVGDPTTQLARLPGATDKELAQLREDYGLDKPLLGQFTDYVGDTVRLDLGVSQKSREEVWTEIKDALLREKLSEGIWNQASDGSLLASAAEWGLMLTGTLAKWHETDERGLPASLKRPVARLGEPVDQPGVRGDRGEQ